MEGHTLTNASANTDGVSLSGRSITGVSTGTALVTVNYGPHFQRVYTVTVLANQGVLRLPDGILSIEHEAFAGDTGVKFVELPDSVNWIANDAFTGTNLQQIIIPNEYIVIEEEAFGSCKPTVFCKPWSSAWYFALDHGMTVMPLDD